MPTTKLTGVYWQARRDARGGRWVGVFKSGAIVQYLPLGNLAVDEQAKAQRAAKAMLAKLKSS